MQSSLTCLRFVLCIESDLLYRSSVRRPYYLQCRNSLGVTFHRCVQFLHSSVVPSSAPSIRAIRSPLVVMRVAFSLWHCSIFHRSFSTYLRLQLSVHVVPQSQLSGLQCLWLFLPAACLPHCSRAIRMRSGRLRRSRPVWFLQLRSLRPGPSIALGIWSTYSGPALCPPLPFVSSLQRFVEFAQCLLEFLLRWHL